MFHLNNDYPESALPPKLFDAVQRMERCLQAPFPMIAASAIATIALASQRGYMVERKPGLVYPTSLSFITIATRSERKSAIDSRYLKPIRDYELLMEKRTAEKLQKWRTAQAGYIAKKAGLARAITRLTSRGEDTLAFEQLLEKLMASALDKPKEIRFIVEVASAEAILKFLKKYGNSCGVMVDEGSVFFDSSASKHAGLFAKLWGGNDIRVDRTNEDGMTVRSPRFTMSIMVQPEICQDFLANKGKHWRTTGLLSRFLVSYPVSTMGSRYEDVSFPVNTDLGTYDARIQEIMSSAPCSGSVDNVTLKFEEPARRHLAEYANWVESQIGQYRWYSDVSDAASKIAENASRMAAIFHIFEGYEGPITFDTLTRAIAVCNWHLSQFKVLFGNQNQLPTIEQDALDILRCMSDFYQEHGHSVLCPKVRISQYSTPALRKDHFRREAAFQHLIGTNRIQYIKYPNSVTTYVDFPYYQNGNSNQMPLAQGIVNCIRT